MTHSEARAPHTPLEGALQLLGWLALLASLLLLSPGVVTRAAAEPGPAGQEDGLACGLDRSAEPAAFELERLIESLRAQAMAQADAARSVGDGGDEVIVLNGRGYNYTNAPRTLPPVLPGQ